ncbi:cysteine proteinase [Pluteus cervinus]|uniref:Cysteine proteinase n=1 Tax=Pluteus cervinus TaxID=181527 RepID=A0ACD3AKN8_9AGAR|nr:cysteine proteinase [Pluteus cervinus]
MPRRNHKKAHQREKREKLKKQDEPQAFVQQVTRGGLLVTSELEKALEECKSRVAEIAADCRKKNRRFRDIEFDLENDRERCLTGINPNASFEPSDVRRIFQIFDNPSFFIGGADSNDIVQGALGNCWFLSALSTMSTASGLIEKFCVARDEKVGVYGFIFFRDATWNVVIIDDLLFTSIPKFEELSSAEKHLYHDNKDQYNLQARKGGQSLYFAKSGTQGETWVPLIEKAYAKLHGNYTALSGGEAGEAIEDLTGGVTSFISTKDILDPDLFWQEELLRANQDRLFGCAFDSLDGSRIGGGAPTVNGLIGSHAYSVLRAVEVRGKRFVVIRNPWGASEWTGPWSDGSKQWTPEWLTALPEIGHAFGDDGEFVMEYSDFLSNWEQIDRTLLFDSSWVMSSQWLEVTPRPLTLAWSYGDISFTLSVPAATPAVIVLSKLDERYFDDISSPSTWNFDFIVYKKGEKKPYAITSHSRFFSRSINLETHLDAGDYVIHVRFTSRSLGLPQSLTCRIICSGSSG